MYTYNKDDKSYTFSFDDLDIDTIIDSTPEEEENSNKRKISKTPHKKIEVINGGNDLDISPATDYIEIEKPKNEKKENIIIPENNN